ncbi:sugar phosphate isomerase/epimerase family protein [Lihuaxuella thermophila]|uniref:Sugar phosphate isomerase/epimerase n=1 Tax=Lihuaxuella thermophila TaxID=1173111 RepID=A0A1H8CHV9_9BACL|nr:sugar phosphate isomerase/epimerase [Lihuaxuella thermophila]SEM93858.1 Sugar phosphate isomerase/epimerase [Lihuaxuella thermophila]
MKLGLSTYSLSKAMASGEMTVLDAMDWMKQQGARHVEIVPHGFSLEDHSSLVDEIKGKAEELGLEISNYAIGANFIGLDEAGYRNEIERVMRHVDIAHRLGAGRMRHDVASRPKHETDIHRFEADLPLIVSACRQIADYAKQYGIITSVENHGYYVQASDRIQRLLYLVDRDNFKTTLDIGNFWCVDEDPVQAVEKNLPYASMIHWKDFYLRPRHQDPGEGWFQTLSGNFLRGSIFGHGDLDVRTILKIIKDSGYDGFISIEFEGMEDCRLGSKISMDNARRIWEEV